MIIELKDYYSYNDLVIDIAKLFGTLAMSSEFSIYLTIYILSFLSGDVRLKKSHILQYPFTDPTKRKKLPKEMR